MVNVGLKENKPTRLTIMKDVSQCDSSVTHSFYLILDNNKRSTVRRDKMYQASR